MYVSSLIKTWISNYGIKHTCLILWLGMNSGVFYLTYTYYKYSPEYYYLHEMLGVGLCLSRATANVINLNLAVLLLPMCRSLNSALRYLLWKKIPMRAMRQLFDRSKGFHMLCGWTLALASGGHVIGHVMNAKNYSHYYDSRFPTINAANVKEEDPKLIILKSVPGVTGLLLIAMLSMIVSSALYSIRTSSYDLFYYTHRLFILFYLVVLFHAIRGVLKRQTNTDMHVPGCIYQHSNFSDYLHPVPYPESEPVPEGPVSCDKPPHFECIDSRTWLWLSIPIGVYLCDTLYRLLCKQNQAAHVIHVTQCTEDMTEIQIQKDGFHCRPGQYILLQLSKISKFEWHPFTVTQNIGQTFFIHVKANGDWSENFIDQLSVSAEDNDTTAEDQDDLSQVYVDGPFSSPMEDILKHRISVFISGGIGITPFLSICNSITTKEEVFSIRRWYLIWVGRNIASLYYFAGLIYKLHRKLWDWNLPDLLSSQFYLTSQSQSEDGVCNQEVPQQELHIFINKRLQYGRPQWENILNSIGDLHSGSIGLFCCGPKSLTKEVEHWTWKAHSRNSTFHCYHESF